MCFTSLNNTKYFDKQQCEDFRLSMTRVSIYQYAQQNIFRHFALFKSFKFNSSTQIYASEGISYLEKIYNAVRMKVVLFSSFVLVFELVVASSLKVNVLDEIEFHDLGEIQKVTEVQNAAIGAQRCMTDLGCFVITPDFVKGLYRPINLLPQDRATIDTKFILFTKEHPKEHHDLTVSDPEEIRESPLDPTHRTVFLVHGFFDSRLYGKWMEELKDNILLNSDNNVIVVDWSKGNGAPYTQATANTRVVGAEIALLISTLQKIKGVDPMDCHIIGHSLGAHIAGYAGERLKKLGRITGLDPAAPYFQYMPPSVRLDTTDADFVDAIHTDSASNKFLALGMSQAIAHVDFYPNNGMNQPGCTYQSIYSIFLEGLFDAARRFVSCNHQRAVDFFTASLNFKRALPVAYQCARWEDYLDGQCAECGKDDKRCAVLGLQADKFKPHKNDSESIKMFLATSNTAPFWEFFFQIKIKLLKPKTSYTDRKGEIYLDIQGSKNNYSLTLTTKTGNLVHGATYSFLIRKPVQLGTIKNVNIGWKAWYTIFRTFEFYLDYVKIMPMNIESNTKQKKDTKMYCEKNGNGISSKKASSLIECPKQYYSNYLHA